MTGFLTFVYDECPLVVVCERIDSITSTQEV